tara:strand:+ start:43 stop:633 length:591 start_codon:yes stop_codon:yes gene_type:complete
MISAIILAAGLSKRMMLGNKLLLEKNNIPIIKTTLEKIKASKVQEIIIVLGKDSELILNKIKSPELIVSINQNFNDGISTSIKKGIKKINSSSHGVMICLGDMPLIKTSTYNKIINSFYNNNKKNIIPCFNKNRKGNPVLFARSYFKKLMEIKGDEGAKKLILNNPNDFIKISIPDKGILEDIDNEKQYYNFIKNE